MSRKFVIELARMEYWEVEADSHDEAMELLEDYSHTSECVRFVSYSTKEEVSQKIVLPRARIKEIYETNVRENLKATGKIIRGKI